ncbi:MULTISPECIES: K(+)-transporting ATPase subunit F [Shewanella]|jgi:K+-transporting ATPase KdpF subunit|uniref:K+-transporting ATPase, F subunit n=3 Tax=Bacteria TaxID=2 RepID=A0A380BEK3_9GAMM|nr:MULTISPECIES: K(+)-transporting ATPase subunit F [Shewanella]EKT4489535.1 K(+)-transporting ATPase subunit F [Shewanella algae]MBO2548736.1 K(+)-transporting ATPase subunit F [Shewanella algae]MBO2553359.1 K(+)-transporting ATPase subunit F [Shewanella algae]MBO2557612.1 K(+)-transporting ATPase subunit F [Shewanella algae]MBO2561871.1 K(+)-transporting ATPase subunit F [Shewanella algae]
MAVMEWAALLLALGLFGYLFFALLHPEDF